MKFKFILVVVVVVVVMFFVIPVQADSDILLTHGEYEIHATILLPHLREAHVNTKTIETRCLDQLPASELFPILKTPIIH